MTVHAQDISWCAPFLDHKGPGDQIHGSGNLQAAGSLMQVPGHPENRRPEDVWAAHPWQVESGEWMRVGWWTPAVLHPSGR